MTSPRKDRRGAILLFVLCVLSVGAFLALHEMGVW